MLTPCFECGHAISDTALSCPRCSSFHPHGVVCAFCDQRLRETQSISMQVILGRNGGRRTDYYHQGCKAQREKQSVAVILCVDCGAAASAQRDDIRKGLWRCSECGSVRSPRILC